MTPTQRTLRALREQGRVCDIVERYIPRAQGFGNRSDAFGFIDIICIDPIQGIVAVQSTGSAFSQHIHKMTEETGELLALWLQHAPVELWGWRRTKLKRGGKAVRWNPRVADFYLEDNAVKWKERKC